MGFLFVCVFKETLGFYKNISVHSNLNGNLLTQGLPCCSVVFRTNLGEKYLNYYSCLHIEIRRHGFGIFPSLQKREKVRAQHFQTGLREEKPQGFLRKALVSL